MSKTKDQSVKVVLSAVTGNGIITVAKTIGWFMTASPSMLAEAIHSLADTCNQILLYVGIYHGKKGASQAFPMGQGRARYIWNLISAIGIFFIGFGITAYHGIHSLLTGHGASNFSWKAIGILVFAFVVEGYVFLIALKTVNEEREGSSMWQHFRHGDDPTSIAVLFEDGIAVLGIIFALTGIGLSQATGSHLPDAIASIIIACLLGVMAVGLAYANSRLLIGAAAHPSDEREIRKFLESQATVEKVVQMKTNVIGPERLSLSLELEIHGGALLDREMISRDAEKIRSGADPAPILVDTAERTVRIVGNEINRLEKALREKFPELTVIELEVN